MSTIHNVQDIIIYYSCKTKIIFFQKHLFFNIADMIKLQCVKEHHITFLTGDLCTHTNSIHVICKHCT